MIRSYTLAHLTVQEAALSQRIRRIHARCDLLCPGDVCRLGHAQLLGALMRELAAVRRYRSEVDNGWARPVVEDR